jgi:ubiquinone/menaquinone biosynthesis C-methylase UbiE
MSSRDQERSPQSGASGEASQGLTQVTDYFGRLASVHGEGEYYRKRRAAVVAAIVPEVSRARTILDLGCGNGCYTADFRGISRASRIVAADLSFEMLAAARQRGMNDIRLVRCDASVLPFLPGAWELIFCSHVLPFVADLDRCLAEIVRSLASGGMLIATFGGSGVRDQLRKRIDAERWRRFDTIAFGAKQLGRADTGEDRYRAAYERGGLVPQAKDVSFSVSWTGIEEWISLRWLSLVDERKRVEAEGILKLMRPADASSSAMVLHEPLLLGRKP